MPFFSIWRGAKNSLTSSSVACQGRPHKRTKHEFSNCTLSLFLLANTSSARVRLAAHSTTRNSTLSCFIHILSFNRLLFLCDLLNSLFCCFLRFCFHFDRLCFYFLRFCRFLRVLNVSFCPL